MHPLAIASSAGAIHSPRHPNLAAKLRLTCAIFALLYSLSPVVLYAPAVDLVRLRPHRRTLQRPIGRRCFMTGILHLGYSLTPQAGYRAPI